MKDKLTILFVLIMTLTMLTTVIMAATNNNPSCNFNIQMINQDPNPGVPNEYVKILFKVTGTENPSCSKVSVKLLPEYPFSMDPGTNEVQSLDGSTYVAGYNTNWMIPYKLRIASDALEGDYNLKLLYMTGDSKDPSLTWVEKTYPISIIDSQTNFDIVVQDATTSQVSFGVVNTGKNIANSLIVKIPQQTGFRVTGSSEQIVGNLDAGDYTIVSFGIGASRGNRTSNSDGSNQPLKIQIDYTDEIGKRRSVTKDIQFNQAAFSGNSTRNFTSSRTSTTTTTAWYKTYYFYFAIILLIIGYIYYKRKNKFNIMFWKSRNKNTSSHDPDWVQSERTKHKK
jgi:preprotein translocase subunit SecG